MKKLTIIIAVVVVGALAATPLYAAVFRAGESVAINASDVQGSNDVYSAGGSVSILSAISGDAVLAGGTIIVSGNVANDLVTVGGSVVVSGNVGGDARIAGGSLVVEGDIAEDMLIGGGDINISNAVAVGGDLYVAGGAVNVRGTVTGETKIRAGQVTLGGNFTGTRYEPTYQKINTIWDMWLFISLIGMIIWGIVSTMRRKDQYEI